MRGLWDGGFVFFFMRLLIGGFFVELFLFVFCLFLVVGRYFVCSVWVLYVF